MPKMHFFEHFGDIYSKRHLQADNMRFFPLVLCFTTVLLGHAQKSTFGQKWPLGFLGF